MTLLTVQDVLTIYNEVTKSDGEVGGNANSDVLHKLLAKPFATSSGLPTYPTLLNKVAVLIQGIIFEKPLPSDNDAVAMRCAELILDDNGYTLQAEESDIEQLIKGIEIGFTTWQRITVWLKKHTVRRR